MKSVTQKFQNLLKSTYNRDKVAKLFQYFYRFMIYYRQDVCNNKEEAKRMETISSHISLGRKLFRLGRFVHEYETIINFFQNQLNNAGVNEWINLVKFICISKYWVFDNLFWLCKVGIYKGGDLEKFKKLSYFFWFLSALFAFIQSIIKVQVNYIATSKALKENNKESLKKQNSERTDVILNFIKTVCDMFLALSFCIQLKIFPQLFSTGNRSIGLFGVVSSITDLKLVWKSL